MKTNYILGAAVALALVATGCSDDQIVQAQEPADKGHQVRVTASMGIDSRLGITDTGTRLEYVWTADDVFHVYDPANSQATTFKMDEVDLETNLAYGTFVGTPEVAYKEGDKLYAVYNKQQEALVLDEDGNVKLDISRQNGRLNDEFQFLFAESTYTEETNFFFHHLVTMLKFNVTVPEGVTLLKNLQLTTNSDLPTQATLVLNKAPYDSYGLFKAGDLVVNYNRNFSGTTLSIEGDFVPEDGVVTVYLYVFPAKMYYDDCSWYNQAYLEPSVWMEDEAGNEYVGTAAFDGKKIEAGKTYQLNTGLQLLEPFANESVADGTSSSPYEIATAGQLYTFMLRCNRNLYNPTGNSYSNCYYKLTNDIKLDNEHLWLPVSYYAATFDGQGHTISGNIRMHANYWTGLFSYLDCATVSNLNLDLNPTFDTEYNTEYFGMLAAGTYSSRIVNCVNHSDVSGYFWRMGGLVGDTNWNTSMEACGNTGDLTALGECRQMGGIVANSPDSNNTFIGCYNTGNLSVNTVTEMYGIQAGGILGMSYAAAVSNCWSRTSLDIENAVYDDHYVDGTVGIFLGGIVGYMESAGTLTNCYWQEDVESALGYQSEAAACSGVYSFEGSIPTAEQFAVMNASLASTGWTFNVADGTLGKVNGVVAPSVPKEEW